ncbi:MAG TPA: YbaB/EbfC family nucleoid-associated protein [Acidobacteriaceae bacterium]|nr:YbaB/EbfC family nucleoid-associated protein [Acidobacteriaceae bacterium]
MDLSNIKGMMEQAQQMQQQMEQAMTQTAVEGSAGAGAVTVQMNGHKQVLQVRIDPSAAGSGGSSADLEMLQDLIAAACNDAARRVDEALQGKLSGAFGGMNLLNMLGK